MVDNNEHNPIHQRDGMRSVYVALYFIGAVLSGAGGNYLWMRNLGPDVVAPDRYTGTQASELIGTVERIDRTLTKHMNEHPDQLNQFDRRIATLEAQYVLLIAGQQRILDKLDKR